MLEFILVCIVLALIIGGVVFVRGSNDVIREDIRKEKAIKKGEEGERRVQREIEKNMYIGTYLLNDVVLIDKEGKSYQIDHIFINRNGIWIIETKNWAGRIYGSDEQKEWTQVLAYGKEKHRHYNPVKQNFSHVYKISPLLGRNVPVIPLVVFVDADLQGVMSNYVCHIKQLSVMLQQNYGTELTEKEREECYKKLLFYQEKGGVTSEEHSQKMKEKKEGIQQGICPNCGARLVERQGVNGVFYGCSRYPHCHFTINKKD